MHIVTPENVEGYLIDSGLHPNWRMITNLAEKTDCIRIALINKYGGFWVDSDTLIIKPLQNLLHTDASSVFLRWGCTGTLLNGYFYAEARSPFIKNVLDQINNILGDTFKENYASEGGGCHLGQNRLNHAAGLSLPYAEAPLKTFIPFEFPPDPGCWYRKDDIANYITNDTVAIGLNMSQYSHEMKLKSIWDHLAADNMWGSCFRYSEAVSKLL